MEGGLGFVGEGGEEGEGWIGGWKGWWEESAMKLGMEVWVRWEG